MSDYTIEDAYASAQTASNLRMNMESRTPIDVVLAIAISKNRLGSAIMRLHTEWDRVRGDVRKTPSDASALECVAHIDVDTFMSSRLREVSQSLPSWRIVEQSLVRRCQEADIAHASSVVRSALFYFLNPTCEHCHGTGVDVRHGRDDECKACKGTGRRRLPNDQNMLAILDYMDACVAGAVQQAQRYLHG